MHVGPLNTKGRCKKPPTFKRIENTDWWISLIATGRQGVFCRSTLKTKIMQNALTPYERFQMVHYGNILPEVKNTKDEDLEASGLEELNRLAEWMESMAEIEQMEK